MPEGGTYSTPIGFIFIFNLVVGTGALTLPLALQKSGWLLGLIMIFILAFLSFITVTFVIEAMAIGNALQKWKKRTDVPSSSPASLPKLLTAPNLTRDGSTDALLGSVEDLTGGGSNRYDAIGPSSDGLSSSIHVDTVSIQSSGSTTNLLGSHESQRVNPIENDERFEIVNRLEMGQLARMFFNKAGLLIFYLAITLYLYGDLAIYAAAVPKSLMDVTCTYASKKQAAASQLQFPLKAKDASDLYECSNKTKPSDPCWSDEIPISRENAYRIYLTVFLVSLGPFVFFNVQKTKFLQILTTAFRWSAFGLMITLTIIKLAKKEGKGHPAVVNFAGLPAMFGAAVYSFMCHHSLPSLITPINNKNRLNFLFASDFTLILVFYLILSFTGIFAFDHLQDLYTLNFQPNTCNGGGGSDDAVTSVKFFEYFLSLFPVFTLSTSFPIIGITLRNNLIALIALLWRQPRRQSRWWWWINRIFAPILTLLPPVVIALITYDVDFLVGITGSYAGAFIQFLVPAALVHFGRKQSTLLLGPQVKNKHRSPFGWKYFPHLITLWGFVAIIIVTVNNILK